MRPDLHERYRFYKHLRIFLFVLGLMVFFSFARGNSFEIRPWMVIWGFGLVAHYFGVFGSGCSGYKGGGCGKNRIEPLEDPKEKGKWKNSDLV